MCKIPKGKVAYCSSSEGDSTGKSGSRKTFAVDIDGTITENGGGRVHLGALKALRNLERDGHTVIYVTGRSSVEGFVLSVFGGTTNVAVGENGGCITLGPDKHVMIGDLAQCRDAFDAIRAEIPEAKQKNVFPRMTEVVMERTFDIDRARSLLAERGVDVLLSDSQYAYHINSPGVDKGSGFGRVVQMLSINLRDVIAIGDSVTDLPLFRIVGTSVALGNAPEDVKAEATIVASLHAGDGVLEALDKLAPTLSGS